MAMLKEKESESCKISLEEVLYYLFFGILFAAKGVGMDEGQKLFTLCILTALVCLAGKLCVTRHSLKEWLVMALLIGLSWLIYKSSGEKAAFFAMLVIIGMKNIPIRRLLVVCLGIWSAAFALSVTLGILHIRDGVVVVHQKLGMGPIIRWSLGYTHPNVLHVSYFVLAALILYVCRLHGKKLLALTGVLFAGNILVFLFSISYTGVLLLTGYLFLNVYLDLRKKLTLPEKFLLQCILPVCVLFPLVGPFVLKGRAFDFFNKLLSTRFELVQNFYTHFKVSLFGTPAHFNTTAHLTLDSSFAYLLMYYGIAAFVLFIAGYAVLIWRFMKKRQDRELALMIGIAVAGITEQFLFNLSFKNISFFFLGALLFELLGRRKNPGAFWSRERAIVPFGEKSLDISGVLNRMKSRKWKQIVLKTGVPVSLAAALVAALFCAVLIEMPDSVYVNRAVTDYRNPEEEVFLDMDQVPEDFHSIVIDYAGPEVGMYHFTGAIIRLEYVRSVVGAGVLAAGFVMLCFTAFALIGPKRRTVYARADRE